jgi:hypothetical protein
MTLTLTPKPTLEEFIQTCTPLAVIPTLEHEFELRVASISASMRLYQPQLDPSENLAQFLQADVSFLGIILALTNLSQEKFLRLLSAERFANDDFGREWSIKKVLSKIKRDNDFAHRIALLFLEGRNNALLAEQVATFYLDQLSLPQNWDQLIHDADFIQNVIRRKLTGEYTDKKGDAIEAAIREVLVHMRERYGVTFAKGQVSLVDKEVDHVLPSREDAYVMIMTSYMETTSSSQTARANEQSKMFQDIEANHIRHGQRRVLINFVDGAGWLARRSDLRKMHAGCHFIVNLKTLDQLEAIICQFVPERYFAKTARPEVILL